MNQIHTIEAFKETIRDHQLVLTYISGTNCGVCSSIKPKIQEILNRQPALYPVEINSHEDQELAAQLSVFTIPAVLVHAQGKESIREARYFSLVDLEQQIERLVGFFQ